MDDVLLVEIAQSFADLLDDDSGGFLGEFLFAFH